MNIQEIQKNKNIKLDISFVFLIIIIVSVTSVIVSVTGVSAAECNDLRDNDFDAKVDFDVSSCTNDPAKELISNGGFERFNFYASDLIIFNRDGIAKLKELTDWRIQDIYLVNTKLFYNKKAPQGEYAIELPESTSFIEQNIVLPMDSIIFKLDFYQSAKPGKFSRIKVFWNGKLIGSPARDGKLVKSPEFVKRSYTLRGISGTNTLRIERHPLTDIQNPHGGILDNVSIIKKSCPSPDPQCQSAEDDLELPCKSPQIIMKVFSLANSHGALWGNNSFYSYAACYDEIFGVKYTAENPHQCANNNANKVLNLFSKENSHVEVPEQTNYNNADNAVCYGDLRCHSINTANNERCNNNEKVVASLSSLTNSHLSLGNDPNYQIKICCKTNLIASQCSDGFDNDGDGLVDRDDPDCRTNPADPNTYDPNKNPEGPIGVIQCNDGRDNDGDGLVDSNDPDCDSNKDIIESVTQCNDGRDNDGDGLIDSNDPNCENSNDNVESPTQCSDGIDNDGDGKIDSQDSDCVDSNDKIESPTQCSDGRDNDGDGLTDRDDPDCWTNPADPNTYDPNDNIESQTQCNDNRDNDGDGLTDRDDPDCRTNPADPNTYDPNDNIESPTQCNDNRDNDGDGKIDLADPNCENRNDNIESPTQCSDGRDNDGDGLIDLNDPDCENSNDNIEGPLTQCSDGRDNDGDLLIDSQDPDCWTNPADASTYNPADQFEGHESVVVTTVSWKNMKDEAVTSADLNDLVKLTISGAEFQGKNVFYKIFKDVDLGADDLWHDEEIVAQTNNLGFIRWRAGKKETAGLEAGNYYFKATIGNSEFTSGTLTVSATEKNEPPVTDITSPKDKGIYFKDEILTFTQNSYDVDDEFSYIWRVGDLADSVKEGTSINKQDYQFTFSYGEVGQKNILLKLTDTRGLSAIDSKDQHSILLIDHEIEEGESVKHILAYIDTPKFGETYSRIVQFDARSTYAIKISILNDVITINCIAGNCPSQTESKLNNQNIIITGAPTQDSPPNYDPITFEWVLDSNVANKITATGLAGAFFEHTFAAVGRHTAVLTASVNPSSSSNTEFNVFFTSPICLLINSQNQANFPGLDAGKSYWYQNAFPVDSSNNCYDAAGVDVNGDSKTMCCPLGYTCNRDSNKCVLDLRDSCDDFTTQQECEVDDDAHDQIASSELDSLVEQSNFPGGCDYVDLYGDSGKEICTQYISCKCKWYPATSDSPTAKCKAVSNHKVKTFDLSKTWDTAIQSQIDEAKKECNTKTEPTLGQCIFDFTYSGSCLDGDEFITRSWSGQLDPPGATNIDYCKNGSDVIPCAAVARLSFFTAFNFIITLLLITFIYFILAKRKNFKEQKINKNQK